MRTVEKYLFVLIALLMTSAYAHATLSRTNLGPAVVNCCEPAVKNRHNLGPAVTNEDRPAVKNRHNLGPAVANDRAIVNQNKSSNDNSENQKNADSDVLDLNKE